MAVLKDLIVHGASRFINAAQFADIKSDYVYSTEGAFDYLKVYQKGQIASLDVTTLKATTARVVESLTVDGDLHTNNWTNSNIATIDGNFYITPTVTNANAKLTIVRNTASGTLYPYHLTLGTNGTNWATVQVPGSSGGKKNWTKGCKVLVTGDVTIGTVTYPLGTCKGILFTDFGSSGGQVLIDSEATGLNLILNEVGTISQCVANLKLSVYQVYDGAMTTSVSGSAYTYSGIVATAYRPIGILLTAKGTSANSTFIDIYGGVNDLSSPPSVAFTDPNVRIGNLEGLDAIGGQSPEGWGIYTDNGYFKGTIVAKQGKIGDGATAWTIGSGTGTGSVSYIYAPTNGPTSKTANTVGMYIGTDGINNFSTTTQYVRIYDGKIYAQGADISGAITATSLTLGSGVTIPASTGVSGLSTVATTGKYTDLTSTPDLTVYVAKNGVIGTEPSDSAASTTTGFKVSSAGLLKAANAVITGKIFATSGTIGGWNIGTDGHKSLYAYTNSTTTSSPVPGTAGLLLLSPQSSNTNTAAIAGSGTGLKWFMSASNVFGITDAGALYSTSGKIGGWNISTNALCSATTYTPAASRILLAPSGVTTTSTTGNLPAATYAITAGTDFGVTTAGKLYATGADISGKVTASEGQIGPWFINASSISRNSNGTAAGSYNTASNIYFGTSGLSLGTAFKVSSTGALTATGATFITDNTDLGSAITFKSNSGNNRSTIRVQDEIGSAFARSNDNNNLLNAIILYNDNSIYFSWLNSTNQQKYASFGDNAFIGVPSMFTGDMTISNGSLAITSGNLTMANGNISLSQGKLITSTSGSLLQESTAGNVVVGYGTYAKESGNLNLYAGSQINLIPQDSIRTSKPIYMNDIALHFSGEKGIYSDDQTGYLCRNFIYTGSTKCTALGNNSFATRIYGSSVWSNKSISTSDINLKENLKRLNKNTDNLILNLDTFEFTWKKDTEEYDGEKHFGFIAQNVKKEMENQSLNSSEYGIITDIGYGLGLSYNEFIPMLAHLCQSQQKEINELKQRIIELENKIK